MIAGGPKEPITAIDLVADGEPDSLRQFVQCTAQRRPGLSRERTSFVDAQSVDGGL
jgi:hypothetical protein